MVRGANEDDGPFAGDIKSTPRSDFSEEDLGDHSPCEHGSFIFHGSLDYRLSRHRRGCNEVLGVVASDQSVKR